MSERGFITPSDRLNLCDRAVATYNATKPAKLEDQQASVCMSDLVFVRATDGELLARYQITDFMGKLGLERITE
jgi:hypothetical protein